MAATGAAAATGRSCISNCAIIARSTGRSRMACSASRRARRVATRSSAAICRSRLIQRTGSRIPACAGRSLSCWTTSGPRSRAKWRRWPRTRRFAMIAKIGVKSGSHGHALASAPRGIRRLPVPAAAQLALPDLQHGQYIVEHLGLCGDCHTPRDPRGGRSRRNCCKAGRESPSSRCTRCRSPLMRRQLLAVRQAGPIDRLVHSCKPENGPASPRPCRRCPRPGCRSPMPRPLRPICAASNSGVVGPLTVMRDPPSCAAWPAHPRLFCRNIKGWPGSVATVTNDITRIGGSMPATSPSTPPPDHLTLRSRPNIMRS